MTCDAAGGDQDFVLAPLSEAIDARFRDGSTGGHPAAEKVARRWANSSTVDGSWMAADLCSELVDVQKAFEKRFAFLHCRASFGKRGSSTCGGPIP
jgi:hypothetical protein